nr:PREDICTED: uncharacterized protein LOC105670970 [Linepithema humile]
MAPTRVILMSCGSYNPPTNMHLRMFEIARDHLHRMGTHIVVGGIISPVHDAYAKKELASATHRCAMLRLALQNSDWIRLSTWETKQNCWTKTRLSLQHHQNLLNSILSNSNDIKHHLQIEDTEWIPENVRNSSDNTPIQIKLLCGADLLESFGVYGLWLEEDIDTIVGEHGLVVITREGSNPNKFIYDSDILSKHMHNICIVTEWIPNEVSSTRIRRALKRSESVRYLLQDSVIDYIYKHEIYDARVPDTTIKLELPSPISNNYLHIDPRYLTAFLTPSPTDVTMDSPSPVEIVASIDVPDAVVLRKNMQNASGLDEAREQFINSVIGGNVDNGNVKHVARAAYPGQAKQVIASKTGVLRIVDEVGPLDEPTAKLQLGPSSGEGHKPTIDGDAKGKTEIGQREVSDSSLPDDRKIILKVQPNSSSEPKQARKSSTESLIKGKTDIGQREISDLRSKTEIVDVDLILNNSREIQSSYSNSGELRLGECCWPTRENTANDKIEVCDRKVISETEIIDIQLGLDQKSTLAPKEKRRSVEAIGNEINSDQFSFSKAASEISSGLNVKSVGKEKIDKEVNIKKEVVNIELDADGVVKIQPAHSNRSIIALNEDRKSRYKDNVEPIKIDKNDTEQTKLSSESIMKHDVEIGDIDANSKKETTNFELDKVRHLEVKTTTLSPPLDGRHECALSDFGVDKEDYRLTQYGLNGNEKVEEKSTHTARKLSKHADERDDTLDDVDDFVNDSEISSKKSDAQLYKSQVLVSAMIHKSHEGESECFIPGEIDNRAKYSEELDRSKFIVERLPLEAEADSKINILSGERTERESAFDQRSLRTGSYDSSLEIDGKYLKSIVNARKSPRKIREDQICDVEIKKQHRIVDDKQPFPSSFMKTKSLEMIKKEEICNVDIDIVKKAQTANDREASRTEKVSQGSSRSTSMKMKSSRKVKELDGSEREFKDQDNSINDREIFRAEKVFQSSSRPISRSTSMKTKSSRKIEELQTGESEFKNQDKAISDQETSRSEKASHRSSRSASTKSPKKGKKSQILYRSEMKDYDRSINDRVISQLEKVFQNTTKKFSKTGSSKKGSEKSESKKQNRSADNRETSRSFDEPAQHSSRTSSMKSPKIQDQKTVRLNDDKAQGHEATKTTKNADNRTKCDFNEIKDVYTRKVRRYNMPLQGSLDSMIVSEEASIQKPKKDDAFSKKSKSYESIKRIQEVFLGVPSSKANSSTSQLDIPDEFCSICCYMNDITFRTEEEVSSPNQETFYTLRSTCSSLADDDESIECDICGTLNLQESADDLQSKVEEIPCELCRICGEVDGSYDQDSALSADRYGGFKVVEPHRDDDESFEIENCGFQSGTESADDRGKIAEKEKDSGRPKSQSLFIHGSSMVRDQPRELYFIPKDEIAILTCGTRKVGRKGSLFRKKEDFNRSVRDNRRYSSVDSLQVAKMSPKAGDKALKITKNATLIGSADNLQISDDSTKSKSLQRSADVGRLNVSSDNLTLPAKNLSKESEAEESSQKPNMRDKEEVKMILTQHGIKIISEKETAL